MELEFMVLHVLPAFQEGLLICKILVALKKFSINAFKLTKKWGKCNR